MSREDARENAERAVRDDPVVREAEATARRCDALFWKAVMLSPRIEACETLMRGEDVPEDRLDRAWLKRFGWCSR